MTVWSQLKSRMWRVPYLDFATPRAPTERDKDRHAAVANDDGEAPAAEILVRLLLRNSLERDKKNEKKKNDQAS